MPNILVVFLLLYISKNFEYAKAQESQCVVIQDCPILRNLFDDLSNQERANTLVRKHICGYNGNLPKVLCPEPCQTPDGFSGFCEPIEKCDLVKNIAYNSTLVNIVTRNYLRKLVCTIPGEQLSVCCPVNEDEFHRNLFQVGSATNLLPDSDKNECGAFGDNRIRRGITAELNDFPWTVLIHYKLISSNKEIICAGSLINNKYVITAAHCVQSEVVNTTGKVDRVTLGEYNIESDNDCIGKSCADPVVIAEVESVTIHPDWDTRPPKLINYDIALIRLAKPVEFTTFISPICLPQEDLHIQDNQTLDITGWGQTETGNTSTIKLKARVRASNRIHCHQQYKAAAGISVGDGAFCAEGSEDVDTCTGDSGGPIMLQKANKVGIPFYVLAGIVSFGSNLCGTDNFPALYTDTFKYMDWIKTTIRP